MQGTSAEAFGAIVREALLAGLSTLQSTIDEATLQGMVVAHLRRVGSATAIDMARALDLGIDQVRQAIYRLYYRDRLVIVARIQVNGSARRCVWALPRSRDGS